MNDTHNFLSLKRIEERYSNENELIHAVMHGQIHRVEEMLQNLDFSHFESRTSDPVRNMKNYAIIANTLLRKAAEQGYVSPPQLHALSEAFAKEIETATTEQAIFFILKNMARKYTLLVKNDSLKGYSPLIRKMLIHIDSDLSADLSLNAHAKLLHVNPCYLSTTFRKETGQTLTQYVMQKRMELAKNLLVTTEFQIQTVALHCGIHDICYFTKSFKKYTGMTPTAYRKRFSK